MVVRGEDKKRLMDKGKLKNGKQILCFEILEWKENPLDNWNVEFGNPFSSSKPIHNLPPYFAGTSNQPINAEH